MTTHSLSLEPKGDFSAFRNGAIAQSNPATNRVVPDAFVMKISNLLDFQRCRMLDFGENWHKTILTPQSARMTLLFSIT
ncbi:hypothetical protein [Thiocystis violacea]|uniref:hypothetical protein n=1 Tax=Thiocystis violacea TaxID=13725 RepID=UPI00190467E7|nr:hypothetical protein [Thiocystis violacea]